MYVSTGPTRWQAAGDHGGASTLEPRSSSCCQRSLVLCVVMVASMLRDFGSLYSMTSRRPWC